VSLPYVKLRLESLVKPVKTRILYRFICKQMESSVEGRPALHHASRGDLKFFIFFFFWAVPNMLTSWWLKWAFCNELLPVSRENFGHNLIGWHGCCFKVQPVTSWLLSVFLYIGNTRGNHIDSSDKIGNLPLVVNFHPIISQTQPIGSIHKVAGF
jgi:hypothetical protein